VKLHYYPETDSLYIELRRGAGTDVQEVGDGIVVDLDPAGNPVGIDIDGASRRLDLATLKLIAHPAATARLVG
jgi:uncharacterized protein YuzE